MKKNLGSSTKDLMKIVSGTGGAMVPQSSRNLAKMQANVASMGALVPY